MHTSEAGRVSIFDLTVTDVKAKRRRHDSAAAGARRWRPRRRGRRDTRGNV